MNAKNTLEYRYCRVQKDLPGQVEQYHQGNASLYDMYPNIEAIFLINSFIMENKLKVFGFIGLSFLLALGILLVLLSSALEGIWWTMFVALICAFVPLPTHIINSLSASADFEQPSNRKMEMAYFITSCMMLSSIALPVILYHSSSITYSSMWMACTGAVVINLSISLYHRYYHFDEPEACL